MPISKELRMAYNIVRSSDMTGEEPTWLGGVVRSLKRLALSLERLSACMKYRSSNKLRIN
jgi:hypothetical protein